MGYTKRTSPPPMQIRYGKNYSSTADVKALWSELRNALDKLCDAEFDSYIEVSFNDTQTAYNAQAVVSTYRSTHRMKSGGFTLETHRNGPDKRILYIVKVERKDDF